MVHGARYISADVHARAAGDRGRSEAQATTHVDSRPLQHDVEGQLHVVACLRFADERIPVDGIILAAGSNIAAAAGARHRERRDQEG